MKPINYLFLIILTLQISCTSDGELSISGTVVAYDTLTPIADAKIIIIGGITNGIFEPTTEFFVDSIFTDENGRYEWNDGDATSADYYSIGAVFKDGYFNISSPISIYGNRDEIILDPHAWLHLNVIDDPTIISDFCRTNATFISGSGVFGEFEGIYRIRGNRDINVYVKTSLEPSEIDTIYLPTQDTLYHEIRF